jgi:hypothetical protein
VTTVNRRRFFIIPALVVTWMIITGYYWWSTRIERHPGLAQRVSDYYAHEVRKEWGDAWTYRTPAFRARIPQAEYVARMTRDSAEWELKQVRVVYSVADENRVKISVIFDEIGPPGYKGKTDPSVKNGSRVTNTEWSIWEKTDGVWYAVETAVRGHLPLNAAEPAPR